SVLIDYGLGDKLAEKLVESGIATVEKLGSMTPEDLEAIQGIGPKMVEKIQLAINAYSTKFEGVVETGKQAGKAEAAPADMIVEEQPEEQEAVEGTADPAAAVAG